MKMGEGGRPKERRATKGASKTGGNDALLWGPQSREKGHQQKVAGKGKEPPKNSS